MATPTPIKHPKRRQQAASFHPLRITIQEQGGGTRNNRGVPSNTWADVEGLVDLPASLDNRSSSNEAGSGEGETVNATEEILLQNYYPTITEQHRAVDGAGLIYNIVLVSHDAQLTYTLLKVTKVTG